MLESIVSGVLNASLALFGLGWLLLLLPHITRSFLRYWSWTMRTQFYCVKGINEVNSLRTIPGISEVWINPLGAGPNIVEIEHRRNAKSIPKVVKDQTVGEIILEPENGRSKNPILAATETTLVRLGDLGGKAEVLYGGYVTWLNRKGEIDTREVRVWGPLKWDVDRGGDGTEIMEAVEQKARKKWPRAECRECWRY